MQKEKQKQVYSAPSSELLEVKTEGVICTSVTGVTSESWLDEQTL